MHYDQAEDEDKWAGCHLLAKAFHSDDALSCAVLKTHWYLWLSTGPICHAFVCSSWPSCLQAGVVSKLLASYKRTLMHKFSTPLDTSALEPDS